MAKFNTSLFNGARVRQQVRTVGLAFAATAVDTGTKIRIELKDDENHRIHEKVLLQIAFPDITNIADYDLAFSDVGTFSTTKILNDGEIVMDSRMVSSSSITDLNTALGTLDTATLTIATAASVSTEDYFLNCKSDTSAIGTSGRLLTEAVYTQNSSTQTAFVFETDEEGLWIFS